MFDLFLGLREVVEGRAQVEAEIAGSRPLFREVIGIRVYVTGIGCQPMGFVHA